MDAGDGAAGEPSTSSYDDDDDGRVYLVPHCWLRESREGDGAGDGGGVLYAATPATAGGGGPMRLINNLFSSDLVFNLRRADAGGAGGGGAGEGGRCYALIRTNMWDRALRWHNSSNSVSSSSFLESGAADVYALKLRVSVVQETGTMTVKISKKDNTIEYYKRASKIFSLDSEMVLIWDFSGQTTLIYINEINKSHIDSPHQADQEVVLELNVCTLLESLMCRAEGKKGDLGMSLSKKISSYGGSLLTNGSTDISRSDSVTSLIGSSRAVGSLGLIGLENLGNTCFMNSAIQCLAHTPQLVDYFLGDYDKEINRHNPLGMKGELALAFGELLIKLWAPERTIVIPKMFKNKLSRFAPQFSGFNQHDSQELLAFLLDGLHEDLNRVKNKPYVEVKDEPDRPDEEVADEYWDNHLARNDSIIVDVCHGQYRSTLVCPTCKKVSVMFDPFMYLSLPLPSTTTRTMTVTVFTTDGTAKPSSYAITVPKNGKCKDLIQSLSVACSLSDDECLLVAEVYSHRIIRYLEEPSDSISLIRDGDRLAAYRLPNNVGISSLVVFTHQFLEHDINGRMIPSVKPFGVPFIARLSGANDGSKILKLFQKLMVPFLKATHAFVDNEQTEGMNPSLEVDSTETNFHIQRDEGTPQTHDIGAQFWNEVQFYIIDEKDQKICSKIEREEEIPVLESQKRLHVLVSWPYKATDKFDMNLLSSLPEICKSGFLTKLPRDSVSLYACIEAFLKEEPLGPEDMWYCPSCKIHQQASKKLDLWRLPKVLVIHLKRFSYSRFMKNKLETFVDFPIDNLDLSVYIPDNKEKHSNCYQLFAVSNHYGSLGGGHYTAYVHHAGDNRWYDFDDRHVSPITVDNVKTPAAYVLFYRKIEQIDMDI